MTAKPLQGRKVLVTAYDLEQSEHRGIAVYSKSLMRCLHEAGAEVWLLTEFFDKLSEKGLKGLPKSTKGMIHNARILNSLALGRRERPTTVMQRKFKLARKARQCGNYLRLIGSLLRRPRKYRARDLNSFELQELYDNPYVRIERLDYLKSVTGIVSAPELYLATQLAAQLPNLRPVWIDLRGFDALVTTCPLNIKPQNLPTFVQTIHDLIPLEYVGHNEDPLMFSHRLQACMAARKIYVSHSTANKYKSHIQNATESLAGKKPSKGQSCRERIIVQTPSLSFPHWLTEDYDRIADLKPVSHIISNESEENRELATTNQRQNADSTNKVEPFRYFLFNSSVETRKNILFLAKAYSESGLYKKGIKLCVTGKLKGDIYSKRLKEITDHETGIVLTGYVDESSKHDLYLNALGLVSPSLVEGFGIPVLDSACLGMPTLASDCESHLEIQGLYDFAEHVLCIETLDSREWAAALQAIAGTSNHLANDPARTRRLRIRRYRQFQTRFTNRLQKDIVDILN